MKTHIVPDNHDKWKNYCGTYYPATFASTVDKKYGYKKSDFCKNCLKIYSKHKKLNLWKR